jgi:hypothetical protein
MHERVILPGQVTSDTNVSRPDCVDHYEPPRLIALGSLHEVLGAGGTINTTDGDQSFCTAPFCQGG